VLISFRGSADPKAAGGLLAQCLNQLFYRVTPNHKYRNKITQESDDDETHTESFTLRRAVPDIRSVSYEEGLGPTQGQSM
jgi:hypothetical protein